MSSHKSSVKIDRDTKYCIHNSDLSDNKNAVNRTTESTATKAEVIELLKKHNIQYCETSCYGRDSICITFNQNTEDEPCVDSAITVLTVDKDVCKIYPHEILYISIDKRNTVLHLTENEIHTPYPINFWKSVLDEKFFMQPHYSYIVNLNYVDNVIKNCITMKNENKKYVIYASSRKIASFKNALLKLKDIDTSTD